MKRLNYIVCFISVVCFPRLVYTQVDFNKTPNDDLGIVEDEFQELFFEALKQKGIENYDRAAQALEQCIVLDKSKAILYFELGKNYIALKNFGAAEDALKTAIQKAPSNEWYLDELYGYYVSQNNFEEALKTVQQLVKYHPDYKEDLARLYVKMERYDDALEILDGLDASFGISAGRDVLRNRIYKATGKVNEQITNLETRVEDNPKNEANYLSLIYRYSEQGKKQKAFKTAKALLRNKPNSQVVHLALYKFYLDENNIDDAVNSMKVVVQSNTIEPKTKLKVLSDFMNFVKLHPEYEDDLMQATTILDDNADTETIVNLAEYHMQKGNMQKALTNFEKALTLNTDNFNVLKNIVLIHIDLKEFDIAKTKSEAAILKYPAQPLFYLTNGVALNSLNLPKEAITILQSGLDWILDDTAMEADFYVQLANAYKTLLNSAKAKLYMDKANALKSK